MNESGFLFHDFNFDCIREQLVDVVFSFVMAIEALTMSSFFSLIFMHLEVIDSSFIDVSTLEHSSTITRLKTQDGRLFVN